MRTAVSESFFFFINKDSFNVKLLSYLYAVVFHIHYAFRKRKMEEHVLAMTWKINYSDITFPSNGGGIAVNGASIHSIS